MRNNIITAVAVLLCAVLALHALRSCHNTAPPTYRVDTLVIHDTVRVTQVKPVKTYFVKYDTLRLKVTPDYATVLPDSEKLDSGQINVESMPLLIPISRQEFKTDSFRAVMSGFNVKLDTFEVFRKERIITVQKKPPRWALTVGVGLNHKLEPFPVVGVGYVIFGK